MVIAEKIKIASPLSGKVIPLIEIKDAAFASGVLGNGIGILPDKGVLVSPVNGTVDMLPDTKHAVTVINEEGAQILIHIGMDTVGLAGKPFFPKVKEGDTVKTGDTLIEFDIQAILNAGLDIVTPIVIANTEEYRDFSFTNSKTVTFGDELMSFT